MTIENPNLAKLASEIRTAMEEVYPEIPPLPKEIELDPNMSRFWMAWNPRPKRFAAKAWALLFVSTAAIAVISDEWIFRAVALVAMLYSAAELTRWGGNHWKGFIQGWIARGLNDRPK